MARNMIEVNKRIFGRLAKYLPEDVSLDIDRARWIETNAEEKEVLKNGKVVCETCLPNKTVVGIEHDGQRYFVFPATNFEEPTFMRGTEIVVSDNAGILTLLWGEANYPILFREDLGYRLANAIFGERQGYKCQELKPFFEDFIIWKVDPGLWDLSRNSSFRLLGGLLTRSPEQLSLGFSQEVLSQIRVMLEEPKGKIIGEMLFRAMTSTHWEHAFLELYRCIERLYPVPYIKALASKLPESQNELELARVIEDSLGWYPREEQALIQLFSTGLNEPSMSSLKNALSMQPESTNEACASAFYKTRNRIAHWRPSGDLSTLSINWALLFEVTGQIVEELYSRFQYSFVEVESRLPSL